MKLFIMSDIHGSSYFLKKAIECFKNEQASSIIILGDQLYHGPRNDLPREYNPKACIEMLNKLSTKIIAVRGNCDAEVEEMVLNYPLSSTYSFLMLGEKRIFLTHGHIYNDEKYPPLCKGDSLFLGHTHIPVAYKKDGITFINPGSISIPKENNPHTYGILENNVFTIKTLDGEEFKKISI